jgi:chorismate mutase
MYNELINSLLTNKNETVRKIGQYAELLNFVSLSYLSIADYKRIEDRLAVNLATILGGLESMLKHWPSKQEQKELEELRKDIDEIEETGVRSHLLQAVDEYTSGHFLATVLIAGKVVIFTLEQMKKVLGADNEREVAEKLTERLGLDKNKEDGKRIFESILKASRHARNFFTHDISAVPSASEALSLLSDAVNIAKWYSKLKA